MATGSLRSLARGIGEELLAIGSAHQDALQQLMRIGESMKARIDAKNRLDLPLRAISLKLRDVFKKDGPVCPAEEFAELHLLLKLEKAEIEFTQELLQLGPSYSNFGAQARIAVGYESVRKALGIGEFTKPSEPR